MKYKSNNRKGTAEKSPSMRREWIEMRTIQHYEQGSKSPSMRREWIEMRKSSIMQLKFSGLPPCGGSGLKCNAIPQKRNRITSPSMRREWIEIMLKRLKI